MHPPSLENNTNTPGTLTKRFQGWGRYEHRATNFQRSTSGSAPKQKITLHKSSNKKGGRNSWRHNKSSGGGALQEEVLGSSARL